MKERKIERKHKRLKEKKRERKHKRQNERKIERKHNDWKKGKEKESIKDWKKERNEWFEYWKGLKMKRRSEVKAEWMNTSVWYIVTLISYLISGWQAGLNMEEEGDVEKGGVHMDQ